MPLLETYIEVHAASNVGRGMLEQPPDVFGTKVHVVNEKKPICRPFGLAAIRPLQWTTTVQTCCTTSWLDWREVGMVRLARRFFPSKIPQTTPLKSRKSI